MFTALCPRDSPGSDVQLGAQGGPRAEVAQGQPGAVVLCLSSHKTDVERLRTQIWSLPAWSQIPARSLLQCDIRQVTSGIFSALCKRFQFPGCGLSFGGEASVSSPAEWEWGPCLCGCRQPLFSVAKCQVLVTARLPLLARNPSSERQEVRVAPPLWWSGTGFQS